jgi:hypothetical protein
MKIDYKKLLSRCMEQWIESEGCCWNAENDKTITNEEAKSIMEISESLLVNHQKRVQNNQTLEEYDNELKRNKRD